MAHNGAGRSVLTRTIVPDALEHVENALGGKSVWLVESTSDGVCFNLVIGQVKAQRVEHIKVLRIRFTKQGRYAFHRVEIGERQVERTVSIKAV